MLSGSHMDVVPANPEEWTKGTFPDFVRRISTLTCPNVDPFKLTIEGDKLYGRGTTDCLGHVALLTDLFLTVSSLILFAQD